MMMSVSARRMTDRKAALVTGGARRIGRAIALALHRAGYAVAIQANRSLAEAEALREEITRERGRAAVVRADLADHSAVSRTCRGARLMRSGLSRFLVNNAAMFEPDAIGALDAERFDRQFAVNLRAPLFLSEAFAAQVRARRGGLDRQHSRSARVQADATFRVLHAGQECGAAFRNAHAGAGAGTDGARECGGARPYDGERASGC